MIKNFDSFILLIVLLMSLLELTGVSAGLGTWWRITYVTADERLGLHLLVLEGGCFKFLQIKFSRLLGGNIVVFTL